MIVGEFPGETEIAKGEPFVGYAGQELNNMLKEAGIARGACFLTNVIRVRPPGGEIDGFIAKAKKDVTAQHADVRGKMVLPVVWEGIDLLKREIELCRPNVIIALGNVALWALTGNWGITSWRGSTLPSDLATGLDYQPKVVAAYNPAMILKQWSWRQIMVQDLRRAFKESQSRELKWIDYNFIIRPSYQTALDYIELLQARVESGPLPLSIDIETRAGHISCIGLAWSKTDALCIPFMDTTKPEGYWALDEEVEIVYRLARLLTHPNLQGIGQNFLYDAQYIFKHFNFIPRLVRDTMIAQHSCFSNMQKGLDFLSSMYCEHHVYWKDEGKEWDPSMGEEQHWTYNCKDAVITFEVDAVEQRNIDSLHVRAPHDFQQRLFWPVLRTMNKGLRVDTAKRAAFALTMMDEIAQREQWIIDTVGYPLNPKSSPQMQGLFYGELGFKPIFDRKSGSITCNDEALQRLAEREPLVRPLVRKIAELRSLGVFLSTFVNAPLGSDGRLRCSYNIAGTDTYRFSSSKDAFGSGLNLQNVPSGGGDGDGDGLELPNIRQLFLPDEGKEFFDVDLSSADLRVVTWEADEPEMKAMLRAGLDPYTEIAKEFYHDASITKKDPRRQTFKSFAHGTNYLGTAKGLAERLGLSVHEAEKTQKWYFGKFPKIKRWQEDLKDQVLKRHMVQNAFGYRMYFFDRITNNTFNEAAAWIPQSTVGCLINRAYVAIDDASERGTIPKVDILLQVHDSLAGQYDIRHRDDAKAAILRLAAIEIPYDDPLMIPVGIKTSTKSWGDCA